MAAEKLPVIELFGPTVQGEGAMIGHQTMFIRFGGCDFDCFMCDSRHAIDKDEIKKNAKYLEQHEIYACIESKKLVAPWVTYSGGNPCLWDLEVLTDLLQRHLFKVAVETQGTYFKPWVAKCNVVTVSPKGPGMGEKCDRELLKNFISHTAAGMVNTRNNVNLKIVCFEDGDLEFANDLAEEYHTLDIYLSVGNPYLTHSMVSLTLDEQRRKLLDKFCWLVDEVFGYKALRRARVLPQLHVLAYGNKVGV